MISPQARPAAQHFLRTPCLIDYKPNTHSKRLAKPANAVTDNALGSVDLEEIGDYIAQDNPVRAGTFVAELRAHCEKICLNPAGYRRRPELSDDFRSCAQIWMPIKNLGGL